MTTTSDVLRAVRRAAGAARRALFPAPEVAAWRRARRTAVSVARGAPGRIRLMTYDVAYADLLIVCPQWRDIFVRQSLRFASPRPDPRVLDCGANIGLASLYFKRLYPGARITAYEADPDLYALLAENLRGNGARDVEAVHAAVWTDTGSVAFRCQGGDAGTVNAFAGSLPGPTRVVPCVRLRDILAADPVDCLKLDIEGAEGAVLDDCGDALANVRSMIVEVHDWDPAKRTAPAVLERIAAAGFTYTLDDLVLMPWRPPLAAAGSPFAGRPLCWAVLVRAWRP